MQEVSHGDAAAVARGKEGRRQGDVADVAAGQLEPARQEVEVEIVVERRLVGPDALPDALPVAGVRKGELDREVNAPHERVIHVLAQVGRQDDGALVLLHALQEVAGLDVGVAVVRVAHLGTLAEQRVGLVEEEHHVARLGFAKDLAQVLLRLADVLAHHGGQIDLVELESEPAGDDLGRHRLSGTRRTGEEHVESLAERQLAAEAPLFEHAGAIADLIAELAQLFEPVGRQHDVLPRVVGLDLLGESRQPAARLAPAGSQQVRRGQSGCVAAHGPRRGGGGGRGALDLTGNQPEGGRHRLDVEVSGPLGRPE